MPKDAYLVHPTPADEPVTAYVSHRYHGDDPVEWSREVCASLGHASPVDAPSGGFVIDGVQWGTNDHYLVVAESGHGVF